jgi:3-hydroxyisobutyrate dehydrogenase-like beta-hydroxyacid dehydrogenase
VLKVAVVGLGEAGALYARGLRDAGYEVSGYDPYSRLIEPGIVQSPQLEGAVADVDFIVTLVGATAARAVTDQVLQYVRSGTLLADFNTGGPELKRTLGAAAASRGVRFVDVAVLAPVPRAGVRTPLMVSGVDADAFVDMFRSTGASVVSIGGQPGDAASRKLIRSVFMKGLAAVLLESMGAAEAAECGPWLRDQIIGELSGDVPVLIDRLIDGSREHAARRVHEVEDARDYLESIRQPNWTMQAARSWLSSFVPADA